MWQALAIATDLIHASLMVAWVVGMPLLVWHRWPRLARWYAVYAIAFVVITQLSRWILGECFLTNIALSFWERVPASAPPSHEWFTVRLAQAVFHMAPSHRSIAILSEILIAATALAALRSLRALRSRPAEGHDRREHASAVP
jgi:hypothetical protein